MVKMKKWTYLLALLIALEVISVFLYLGKTHQLGFPLDDAWIHQTYARNLGQNGMMSFVPGIPSTGSTSAGWTILLAAGYFLNVPFYLWTYLWGCIFAVLTAFTTAQLSFSYFGNFRNAVITAVICIFEWHLAWSAVSGMEISLFIFLSLLFLFLLHRNANPYFIGLVAGLTFLVRPEASIIIAIYGIKLLIENRLNLSNFFKPSIAFATVLILTISPWMIFNLTYSGRPFPSTISSKFIQYGYPFSIAKSLGYLRDVFLYFLDGPLMLIFPCALLAIYLIFRRKDTDLYYALVWPLAIILIYTLTIPAIYHHGRYLMPIIPLLVIFGAEGLSFLFEKYQLNHRIQITVYLVIGGMIAVLWVNGASTFALQIKLLLDNHADAARWVDANTPRDVIIATHDVGLIGYITQRQMIDIAGLITPEVIPIMNDQTKLAEFIQKKNVSYVIVFTGYYREFLSQLDAELVYSPPNGDTKKYSLEPFEVFILPTP
jgi:hypothetical protein